MNETPIGAWTAGGFKLNQFQLWWKGYGVLSALFAISRIDTRENKETDNPNAANLNICTAITFNNFEVTAREIKMSTCQVKTCKNDHRKKEFRNVHFYRFPKEKTLMLKWKEACGKENVDVKNGIFV